MAQKKWIITSITLFSVVLILSLFSPIIWSNLFPSLPIDASKLLTTQEASHILGKQVVKDGSRSWFGEMIKFEYDSKDGTYSTFIYAEIEKGGWSAVEKKDEEQGKKYVTLDGVQDHAVYVDESNERQQNVTLLALKNNKFLLVTTTIKDRVNGLQLTRNLATQILNHF